MSGRHGDPPLRRGGQARGRGETADAGLETRDAGPGTGLHLPKSPAEEKELEAIAVRGTPKDVYAWIYGADSFMTQAVPFATWEQPGQTPQEGLKTILAGIRRGDGLS